MAENKPEGWALERISRRRALKRVAAGAAVAWSAPVLTSLGTPAAARHLYNICEDHCFALDCGAGAPGTICGCLQSSEGEWFCSNDFLCGSTDPCSVSTDCPDGWFCQGPPSTCAGVCGAVCVPPCGTAAAAGGTGPRNLAR